PKDPKTTMMLNKIDKLCTDAQNLQQEHGNIWNGFNEMSTEGKQLFKKAEQQLNNAFEAFLELEPEQWLEGGSSTQGGTTAVAFNNNTFVPA
ncbi:MAG: hypothetical protein AAGJ35_13050, partial [Myxococcota bacterium]